jgi:hypothetical protein
MNVVASINPAISITQIGTLGVTPNTPLPAGLSQLRGTFSTSGSGSDQLSLCHSKTYDFAASTPQTLNLYNGSLVDIFGNPLVFSAVRIILYRIQSPTAGYVITAGNAGTNPWNAFLVGSSTMIWYPSSANNDGYSIIQAPNSVGLAVTSTSCEIKLDPGSNAVGNVDIIIAGS